MRVIRDPGRLRALLREHQIDAYFSAPMPAFQLRIYEKGEFLCSPVQPLDSFLFLVSGTVHLYGLRGDGGKQPVGLVSEVSLFGDMEFSTGQPSPFFAEVTEEAACLALPMREYAGQLWSDAKFLGCVVRALAGKLQMNAVLEITASTLEEKVLQHLEGHPVLEGVGKTAICLHCSRRQLQRVLKKLCEDGMLSKDGKGRYSRRQP